MISIEALFLTMALSIDAFAASFAYGSSKIKIPFKSIMTINIIGTVILGISIYFGIILRPLISPQLSQGLSFAILFTLGTIKIFDSMVKSYIRKHSSKTKELIFSAFNLKFILTVYADPEKADIDKSRIISLKESVAIAVALALDSFAIGFGAGLIYINHFQILLFSLVFDVFAIVLGCKIGNKIAEKLPINLSWIGGLILILLAII